MLRTAQVCASPAVIAVAMAPPRSTAVRLDIRTTRPSPTLVVSPVPSCPSVFLPQHLTLPVDEFPMMHLPSEGVRQC